MTTSFAKHVDMNGLGVYGEKGVSDEKMLYVAAIFAELLDNDENGIWDDSHVFGLAPGASRLTEAMDAARGGHRGILDEPQTCQGIANEWELCWVDLRLDHGPSPTSAAAGAGRELCAERRLIRPVGH